MSIVKCPECNDCVSDNAEACPSCGYGVMAHYQKIKLEEREAEKMQQRLDNVQSPSKPKVFNVFGGFAIFFSILGFISISQDNQALFGLYIILALVFVILNSVLYQKEMDEYELSVNNLDAYKKMIIKREDEWAEYEASKTKFRCPICNSVNVNRIDSIERAVSVGTMGLASGKIGKQYKCKNCKHMW